jgi:hypothetical protein
MVVSSACITVAIITQTVSMTRTNGAISSAAEAPLTS